MYEHKTTAHTTFFFGQGLYYSQGAGETLFLFSLYAHDALIYILKKISMKSDKEILHTREKEEEYTI